MFQRELFLHNQPDLSLHTGIIQLCYRPAEVAVPVRCKVKSSGHLQMISMMLSILVSLESRLVPQPQAFCYMGQA